MKGTKLNLEKIPSYTKFIELPFKLCACWEWHPKTVHEPQIIFNNVYLAFVQFALLNLVVAFFVNFYLDWGDSSSSLDLISESIPFIASALVVHYCTTNRAEMYELSEFINKHFKFHSARGLTNITMVNCYKMARYFQRGHISFALVSVTLYAAYPFFMHCKYIERKED